MRYKDLPNAAWLNTTFLFARDGAALVVLWALAAWFVARRQRGRPVALACWLAFAYCVVFTLLGFDLVMALDPHWFSTLFGGYFFVSGLYAALAAWTLITALRSPAPDKERLHDLGKLMVAFSLLTAYMMFSQLLPLWYENLPNEVRYVVPRLRFERWGWVSAALLAVIYLGPLAMLLTRWSKRTPKFLAAVALAVLAGLWVERWWLVTPTLGGALVIGWTEAFITAAFAAALALGIECFLRSAPPVVSEAGRARSGGGDGMTELSRQASKPRAETAVDGALSWRRRRSCPSRRRCGVTFSTIREGSARSSRSISAIGSTRGPSRSVASSAIPAR